MALDWKLLPRPIIALAPMADIKDSAFCCVVRNVEYAKNKTIIFKEMISAEAVVRRNDKTLKMANAHKNEHPLVQQIFGSNPDAMAKAARLIEERYAPDGIDINMGCPARKIVGNFNGAALMRDAKLAREIVRAVKAAVTIPVSVKMRLGWSDPRECFEFAKEIENAGANLITVHGRTKSQGYSGKANWEIIGELKKTLSIPVLANGDIKTPRLALLALETTKCDGIAVARGALGNPWIFSQISNALSGRAQNPILVNEHIRVIKLHLEYHLEMYGQDATPTFRKHLLWYFQGIPNAKIFRSRINTVKTKDEVFKLLDELLAQRTS